MHTLITILMLTGVAQSELSRQNTLKLYDGSLIVGSCTTSTIDIETKYGVLNVPAEAVYGITVAPRLNREDETKVKKYLNDLDNEDYRLRRRAEYELNLLGKRIYWFCRESLNKDNVSLDAQKRLKSLIQSIEDKHGKNIQRHDEIETNDFTIKGRITNEALDFNNAVLGPQKYKIHEVDSIIVKLEVEIIIEGFHDEDSPLTIKLPSGVRRFAMKAVGEVDIWPPEPNKYMSGPDGTVGGFSGPGGRSGQLTSYINGMKVVLGSNYNYNGSDIRSFQVWINRSPWGDNKPQGSYKITFRLD